MKMDIELIIRILKVIESSDTNEFISLEEMLVDRTSDELEHSLCLLDNANYIFGCDIYDRSEVSEVDGKIYGIRKLFADQLTMKGHDFLEYMKSDEIKEMIKEKDSLNNLAVWEETAKGIMNKKLEKVLKDIREEK